MIAVLSAELQTISADLATHFSGVPLPAVLSAAPAPVPWATGAAPDLGDADTTIVMLVGPDAAHVVTPVHRLARHLGAPVANTWGVKGIYQWDDPHHMGTCGLQRDDFALLGLADFDVLVTIGLDPAESPTARLGAVHRVDIPARDVAILSVIRTAVPRPHRPAPNELYSRIAAIAQPGYVDESVPRHPARAVFALKQSLGSEDRVVAQPGPVGLWVARTFPTDRLGSVIVPAQDLPAIAPAVALVSAARGVPTVCVLDGTSAPDPDTQTVTREIATLATDRDLPLRFETWADTIDWSRTADLVAAAGPVVAWT